MSQQCSNLYIADMYTFSLVTRGVCMCVDYRMRNRCGSSCTSGSSMMNDDVFNCRAPNIPPTSTVRTQPPSSTSVNSQPPEVFSFHPTLNRGSVVSNASSASKPSGALSSLAGLIGDTSKECCSQRVQVMLTLKELSH